MLSRKTKPRKQFLIRVHYREGHTPDGSYLSEVRSIEIRLTGRRAEAVAAAGALPRVVEGRRWPEVHDNWFFQPNGTSYCAACPEQNVIADPHKSILLPMRQIVLSPAELERWERALVFTRQHPHYMVVEEIALERVGRRDELEVIYERPKLFPDHLQQLHQELDRMSSQPEWRQQIEAQLRAFEHRTFQQAVAAHQRMVANSTQTSVATEEAERIVATITGRIIAQDLLDYGQALLKASQHPLETEL